MTQKKRGLGKGLDALLGNSNKAMQKQLDDSGTEQKPAKVEPAKPLQPKVTAQPKLVSAGEDEQSSLRELPLEWLTRGKYQPRKDMSQSALEELANSIRAQGIIQPIVVRPLGDERFEIIAGERRWRAAQLARLEQVPCIIKDVADDAAVAIALIENIQREDLNAIEEAVALRRLLEEFEMTHQQLAEAVGKSRAAVSNLLRLNQLNTDVQLLVEHGDLEMGHARALLALEGEQQSEVARQVVQKELSVRETERLVKKVKEPKQNKPKSQPDPDIDRLARRLSEQLGTDVKIRAQSKERGKLEISYRSLQEFDKIVSNISPFVVTE
ncbi:ParB/RepB/Spo0J family partition protein [Dongshaea marina]|uniref:ParB/RepB/Spo0J family partition protein n=1 Tax=Dongshaea marina TaxID=2047966 RepID=UPI000D3E5CEB|nr:ParB/RepB/Spo0J family partition protein [Dongshaea marina]